MCSQRLANDGDGKSAQAMRTGDTRTLGFIPQSPPSQQPCSHAKCCTSSQTLSLSLSLSFFIKKILDFISSQFPLSDFRFSSKSANLNCVLQFVSSAIFFFSLNTPISLHSSSYISCFGPSGCSSRVSHLDSSITMAMAITGAIVVAPAAAVALRDVSKLSISSSSSSCTTPPHGMIRASGIRSKVTRVVAVRPAASHEADPGVEVREKPLCF